MPRRTDSAPSRSVPAGQVGKGYAVKILILGNQARSTSNFWTVLMRRMRAAGHEVLCAVPAGDDAAEAAIRAIGEEDPAFQKGPAVRLCHYPLDRKGLNPLRDMATMHALYRLFKQEKPCLLYTSDAADE